MPRFALTFRADLENLSSVKPCTENFTWTLRISCLRCRDEFPNPIVLDASVYPIRKTFNGSRGAANVVIKCKNCHSESTMDLDEKSIKEYSADEPASTVAIIECRGLEPLEWIPTGPFIAKGLESNSTFNDIDLSESEWFDYDEQGNCSVSIVEVQTHIQKSK